MPEGGPVSKQKRNILACIRCRKRHVKCPGGEPCEKCKASNSLCEYVEADKKVVVSVKYLQKLHSDIANLKRANTNLKSLQREKRSTNDLSRFSEDSNANQSLSVTFHDNTIDNDNNEDNLEKQQQISSSNDEIVAPFIDNQRKLVYSRTGEKFYVGSSSMTLFGIQVQNLIATSAGLPTSATDTINTENLSSTETVLDREGNAYRIMLGRTKTSPGISVNFTLPSYSYAMLLVDTFIQYNDACFYFFNEGLVKENLRRVYDGLGTDSSDAIIETIWFCKVLLIFAIGEMYLGTSNDINGKRTDNTNFSSIAGNIAKLPGSGFFHQASDLFTGLFSSGAIDNLAREGGVEVLLLYAFYLQVADCTVASYFYFGLALRSSFILGMHVDAEKETLSRYELEHRRRLWWTVYMYERLMSSKAGLPLSLTDNSIQTELPDDFDMTNPPPGCEHYIFPEAEYITNAVKITQINATILSCLYQKQPDSNILPVLTELVSKLIEWKRNLPDFLNIEFSNPSFQPSRLVTNLLTEYFQGMNLAVRPLLFHFASKQLKENKTRHKYIDLSHYSKSIITLFNSSFQASINTIKSLWSLMPDNMVALFGYMDREYLFTAAATLILFNAAFGVHGATYEHLDHTLLIFTKMRNLGNHPAALRREQLLKLMTALDFNGIMKKLISKFETDDIPLNNFTDNSSKQTIPMNPTKRKLEKESQTNYQYSIMRQPRESLERGSSSASLSNNPNKKLKIDSIINNPPDSMLQRPQIDRSNTGSSTNSNEHGGLLHNHQDPNSILSSLENELLVSDDTLEQLQKVFEEPASVANGEENELWKEISYEAMWLGGLNEVGEGLASSVEGFESSDIS